MSESWFIWHMNPDGNKEDGCHPQEAAALKEYLQSANPNAEEAARAIIVPVENESDPIDNCHRLWSLLMDALNDLPEHRIKLITLLQAIQKLPPAHPKQGERRSIVNWHGLPGFGHLWSDCHINDNWRSSMHEWAPEQCEAVRSDYQKQAEIEAQLVVGKVGEIPLEWGYECISNALERSDAALDFEIPAAAEWFLNAGRTICDGDDGGEGGWALKQKNDLWKGSEGWSPERREYWEERMKEIGGMDGLRQDTRDAAKKAIEAIKAVEKAH